MKRGQSKTQVGLIIGFVGLLAVSGYVIISQSQADITSYCPTTHAMFAFDRLSSSNVTGYWTVNGTQKQSVCTKSKWVPLNSWLKQNNLTLKDVSAQPANESTLTEDNIEIVKAGTDIVVNSSKQVSINGAVFNLTYIESPPIIKCVCKKGDMCNMQSCLI